ncbi:hypothetical protein E3N88_04536 [Mikania micrantha]|uniref:Flavodoxin-like domain-containing protein n=1 Tax=Mikania micrantha TaxID=192012 RepID=A0A5N6PWV1_9ASTR|nr:hypothetical protein E3N88_04536 [Mikania micrantha]
MPSFDPPHPPSHISTTTTPILTPSNQQNSPPPTLTRLLQHHLPPLLILLLPIFHPAQPTPSQDDHAADDEYAEKLKKESLAFFFLSTYGDGEPAGNAARFYEWFTEGDAKGEWLNKLQFGVFGLANRQYEHFNMIAKVVDDGLADQGMPSLLHINFSM